MLITLPDSDLTTFYISAWSEPIIELARKNGIKPTPLRGKNVTSWSVEQNIDSKNPNFLAFNGHGSEVSICGQDDKPLITLGSNEHLLDSRIVHALSCSCAKELGRRSKAKAFIGYDDWFWLYFDGNKTAKPLEDSKVKPIMESALEAPKQIVKRKTVQEAYEESQKMYQKNIDELTISSSKHTAEEIQVILPFLDWNKKCQKLYGDPNAKI